MHSLTSLFNLGKLVGRRTVARERVTCVVKIFHALRGYC